MKLTEVESAIESILFAYGDVVSVGDIAYAVDLDIPTAKKFIRSLADKYAEKKRGISIKEIGDGFQMCTASQNYDYVARVMKKERKYELTQPLLETLAIIAYKQPVSKPQIEEIRGVNADHAVNKLMEKNLICEVGRSSLPGKPILFGTTEEFLRHFGYPSLHELPMLNPLELEEIK